MKNVRNENSEKKTKETLNKKKKGTLEKKIVENLKTEEGNSEITTKKTEKKEEENSKNRGRKA